MKRIAIILIFVFATIPIFAGEIHDEAGSTTATFLQIDAGSRPMGMGGAFTGLANDTNTLFWNPAGLTAISDREFSAMQNFSVAEIYTQAIGYTQRLNEKIVFGLGFQSVFTEIQFRETPTIDPDQSVNVGGFATGLSVAFSPISQLSIGGTAKLISQRFNVENSIGFAGDFGAIFRPIKLISIGIAGQNFGTIDSDEDLPSILRVGVALQPLETLSIVGDLDQPINGGFSTVHAGAENWFFGKIAARIGYVISDGENPRNGLTFGFGLKADGKSSAKGINFQFDYALTPDGDLGNSHRISLLTRF